MFPRRVRAAAVTTVTALATAGCEQSGAVAGLRPVNVAGALQQSALNYRAFDLGTLGGATSVANDINERGDVVGTSSTATGEEHAFLWTPSGGMVDLGTLAPGRPSTALAVNNRGIIVGVARNAIGDERAVVWTPGGQIRELATPHGFTSRAEDVNEHGVIVGFARPKGIPFVTHGLRWLPDGTMEDLGTLGGRNAQLAAIDGGGDIVANIDVGPFVTHVLVIRRNQPPLDIGTLGGTGEQGGSLAIGSSGRGHVTGFSEMPDGSVHAFLWTRQTGMRDLGTLDATIGVSQAWGVSSSGTVVGRSAVTPGFTWRPFVWTSHGGMTDLGTLGGPEGEAKALNERGDVVGLSDLPGTPARTHATLWRRGGSF